MPTIPALLDALVRCHSGRPCTGVTYESVREEMRAQLGMSKEDKLNEARELLEEKEREFVQRYYEAGRDGK
jgi:hypothetical protein